MTAEQCANYLEYAAAGLLFGIPVGISIPIGINFFGGPFLGAYFYAAASTAFSLCFLSLAIAVARTPKNHQCDLSTQRNLLKKLSPLGIFCVFFLFGLCRAYSTNHLPNEYATLLDKHSEFVADIVSEPVAKPGYLRVEARAIDQKQKILVSVRTAEDPRFGQRVALSGTMHPAADTMIDSFDYGAYLRSKNIYATVAYPHLYPLGNSPFNFSEILEKIAYAAKDFLYSRIFGRYDTVSSSLLQAVLFGDTSGLTAAQIQQFVRTGSIHLIAVSGFKLTIILLIIQQITRPLLGPKYSFCLGLLVSIGYLAAFAFNPAIIRAAVMSAIFLISQWFGGGYNARRTLLLAAAAMAYANPLMVCADSSFLFSVLGVLGIIMLVPKFEKSLIAQKYLSRIIPFNNLRMLLYVSLAAYLATMPLSLFFYGQLSLIGPITALLVMPLFEPCIILGFASALPVLAVLPAAANEIILRYFAFAVSSLAALPGVAISVVVPGCLTYSVYAIIAVAIAVHNYRARASKNSLDLVH
jgi:competence protein ComEC